MSLQRNDFRMPLVKNGRRRHGQFEWHNEDCLMEDYGIKRHNDFWSNLYPPSRYLWCATHGQWASETPIKVTFTFEDGTVKEYAL